MPRGGLNAQRRYLRERREIAIAMQQLEIVPDGASGDQTVDA
jgi:hypothetical protein